MGRRKGRRKRDKKREKGKGRGRKSTYNGTEIREWIGKAKERGKKGRKRICDGKEREEKVSVMGKKDGNNMA